MSELEVLTRRIEKLEKRNRLLTGGLLILPLLTVVGWQSNSDVWRTHRLEIIDDHNVPLITLSASRGDGGGSIVMRDKDGEKRGWWTAAPGESALTLNSSKSDGTQDTTLGLQVGPKNARMSIISSGGALLSTNMEGDTPKLEMVNAKGATVFEAPWKK